MKKLINTFTAILVTLTFWFLLSYLLMTMFDMKLLKVFLSPIFLGGWILIVLTLLYLKKHFINTNAWLVLLLNKLLAFACSTILWLLTIYLLIKFESGKTIALYLSPILISGWIVYSIITLILYRFINRWDQSG